MTEGIVAGASVSHRRASVEQIEAVTERNAPAAVERLLDEPGVSEAFVLQTCNRAEAYVVAESASAGRAALDGYVAPVPGDAVREMGHEDSLRHLMRVAAGLESLVVGEDQIMGQLRDAVRAARDVDGVGETLEDALVKAIRVGERARDETAINEGVVSLGSAAVALAGEERGLSGTTALVVGAGEMGTLSAKALAAEVDRVLVANRTLDAARHVADALPVDAAALGLDELRDAASRADIVVSATAAPEEVVDADVLRGAGDTFVVDLAQPHDVTPEATALANVDVRGLDDLESLTDETLADRRAAADRVEALIAEEFDRLMAQYKRKRADEVIAAMYEGAERVKHAELDRALGELEADGLTDEQREVVEALADTLVSQLLATPTRSLRDAAEEDDWATIHTALQLFDPSTGAPHGLESADPDELPPALRDRMPTAVLEQLKADD